MKSLCGSSKDAAKMVAGSLPVSYLSSDVGGANVRGGALTGRYESPYEHVKEDLG